MGRQQQPEIAKRLLGACVVYALEHGLPDGLEPLAQTAGTSVRMLVYHFGSKDDLFRLILRNAREEQLKIVKGLLQVRASEGYTVTLRQAWVAMTSAQDQPYLRLFGQFRENTEQKLWPNFRRTATTDWLGTLETGFRSTGRPELATLTLAVIRGLLMDLDATSETTRVNQAFEDFLSTLDAALIDVSPS
jgi:AcrR family transcriptional regulator